MYIADFTQQFPEDWNDENKYPNKKLIYSTPEKDYIYKHKPLKIVDGNFITDENAEEITTYIGLIYEVWNYDCHTIPTCKKAIRVVKCPKCGSYHIKKEHYNNLCPEALAGSAGINYTCKDCGYFYQDCQIMS